MTAENLKIQKRVLNDIEKAYRITTYDINWYIRQAGTITTEVIKRLIRWNYFRNEDAVDLYAYHDDDDIIITMDMFDLQLWILENYDIDPDRLDDIEDELSFLTTFYINK